MINSAQVIETKRRIATMQAWLDGKTIERSCPDVGWRVVKEPQWQWDRVDYRVKPEPRVWEGWMHCDEPSTMVLCVREEKMDPGDIRVKVIEVIE